jgi:copper chaperone CopZ
MVEKQYRVPEISCEHCVRAITTELSGIDGVEVVRVDIPTKIVTVRAAESVSDERIVEGIEEAGYEVAAGV